MSKRLQYYKLIGHQEPTVPADPDDASKPWAIAMVEDAAVQLPRAHCAFKGCAWSGDTDDEREQHLEEVHAGAIERVAELLPACYSRRERFTGAYSEAIATLIRKGAPRALYSIDRRSLYNYANACKDDSVTAPVCFLCACVFPRVESMSCNDIEWWTLFNAEKDTFAGLNREDTENFFGYKTYMKRYGKGRHGVPDLTKHEKEFDDWLVGVSFEGGPVDIICCPEDKVCRNQQQCGPKKLCGKCKIPLCRECQISVQKRELPYRCLANDLMVFYAPADVYTEQMTVMEMICCSVCITSMICFTLEAKYGNLFDCTALMQRHRVGARGTATSFPLPWQQLLAELTKLDREQEEGMAPDLPKVGRDLMHVVQVLLKTNDNTKDKDVLSRFIHQAHVRREVIVKHILACKARGHRAYINVNEDKVRAKANQLPEHGVPPEIMHLLPDDNSISKLQVQKAATPVEGLRAAQGDEDKANITAAAISAQRPNAVVMEKSSNDEGDINERRAQALQKLCDQLESPQANVAQAPREHARLLKLELSDALRGGCFSLARGLCWKKTARQ